MSFQKSSDAAVAIGLTTVIICYTLSTLHIQETAESRPSQEKKEDGRGK